MVLQRKALTPNEVPNLSSLQTHTMDFQQRYGFIAKPFQWKFPKADLPGVHAGGKERWLLDPAECITMFVTQTTKDLTVRGIHCVLHWVHSATSRTPKHESPHPAVWDTRAAERQLSHPSANDPPRTTHSTSKRSGCA
jgi:hypothetical protein